MLDQRVHIQLVAYTDYRAVRHSRKPIDLLDCDSVDLVVDVQTPDILSVSNHDVNELVHRCVAAEQDLSVVDLVLRRAKKVRSKVSGF